MIGNNVTLEFGSPRGFECILDTVYREACKTKFVVSSYRPVISIGK